MDASLPSSAAAATRATPPALSVVVPVHNEAENLRPLILEIAAALKGGEPFEIVYVDDGSSDETPGVLRGLTREIPELRVLRHLACAGQSAAIASGVAGARGAVVATLDGDGQNDPADVPKLLAVWREAPDRDRLLVAGHRAKRQDNGIRRLSSKVANGVRSRMLGDDTPDTGCGLKVFSRATFLKLPHFDHMHRFLPALFLRQGGRVQSVPVNHRPRARGISKYGLFDRLWIGIVDLFGVMWLRSRKLRPEVEEVAKER
jgi:dolichol-phosphate mannosyltransferase